MDLASLLIQVNEIDDFKQFMDVTYIVEIEWKDHRIMNIGDNLYKLIPFRIQPTLSTSCSRK